MNAIFTGLITFALLLIAIIAGMRFPENRFDKATKDAVKLAASLVATLAALVLGLLVSSAKDSYDTVRSGIIEISASALFLDRLLDGFGPESAEARARLRGAVQENIRRMWPEDPAAASNWAPARETGNAVYTAIQQLTPKDDFQRSLKTEAAAQAIALGKTRTMLVAQSVPSISRVILAFLISWLVIIFFSFSMIAPTNAPAITALLISAMSVCGALVLILELDRPFGGMIGLTGEPMRHALLQLGR